MTQPLDASAWTFEEVDSADGGAPLRVVLKGKDAPLGGRGSGGAFDLVVEVRQNAFYYPGQDTPSRQVSGVKYQPLTIRGNLQDRGVVGRARELGERLQRLATRKRRLRITWGPWAYFGLMDSVKLSPEGLRDVNYECTVHIDGPDLPNTALAVAIPVETTPDDLGAAATDGMEATKAVDDAAKGALLSSEKYALAVTQETYLDAGAALGTLLAGLSGAVAITDAEAGRVTAAGRAASREALGYALAVTAVPVPAHRGWERAVAWQRASVAAAEGAWDVSDAAVTAAERLDRITRGEVERRYDVRDGDTLESIARDELGDALRAGEIARRNNLPGHRVQAGQRLFLPVR